jgi:hypothetical protein
LQNWPAWQICESPQVCASAAATDTTVDAIVTTDMRQIADAR